jgi:NAD(P) transhydrogenase subunit alpha
METNLLLLLLFVLVVCLFLGYEVVAKAPVALHLRLLSGLNLFSGVILLAALLAAGLAYGGSYDFAALLGGFAAAFATAGAVGSYLQANRALDDSPKKEEG